MLTIYVSPRDQRITDVTGHSATVKGTFVREGDGFKSLQDLRPSLEFTDVEFVYNRRFLPKTIHLNGEVRSAVVTFLRDYHAQQDISFDCYAFAGLIKGVERNDKSLLHLHWTLYFPFLGVRPGDVIFLLSGRNNFHHAAVYLGSGLYLSVWGAGGDLEVATLKSMMRDLMATKLRIARPRTSVTT